MPKNHEHSAEGMSTLQVLKGLAPYFGGYGWRLAAAGVALVIAASAVLMLGVGLRLLVDRGLSGGGDEQLLNLALLGLFGVIAIMAAATYCRFYLVSWIGERVVADLRRDVFGRVLSLDAAYYESNRTGALVSFLTSDTAVLQTVIGSSVSIALRNTLIMIGGIIMLFITSPGLTGIVLLIIPLTILPLYYFGKRVRRLARSSQDRLADLGAQAEEAMRGIRTVKAFAQERHTERHFNDGAEAAFQAARQRISARAALSACAIIIVFTAIALVLWQGGLAVLEERISPGQLAAFIFYAVMVAGAVGALSDVAGDLQRAIGAAERLLTLLAEQATITAPAAAAVTGKRAEGSVAFEGVTFRYPSADGVALDALSFSCAPGETAAFVGPSGAGKSTVFQLLLRFYDPTQGRILLDGEDVRRLPPAQLRRQFGLVPQEPDIFSTSALENIRFGRPDASLDEVREAASAANADDFIRALPEGYDTYLGERGVRLSGGQKQRLAIARALLLDPPVLLLDEATSALDAESERMIQTALDRLMQGRTTLVIAHRLATVQRADTILVLDHGKLVESGTHRGLIAKNGLYAHLAALQFDWQPDEAKPAALREAG